MAAEEAEAQRLLDEARRLCEVEPDEALAAAAAALAAYRRLGDTSGASRALLVEVGARFRQSHCGQPGEARRVAEAELEAARARGDRFGEAAMKVALAELHVDRQGEEGRAEALEMAKDAKAAFIDIGDGHLEARATEVLASLLIKMCDRSAGPRMAKEALKYAREAANMASALGDRPAEAKALYLTFCAKMYTEASWRDGLRYAKESALMYAAAGCRWWQGTVLRTIADWAALKGQGQDGLPYAEEALAIFREIEEGRPKRMGWEASALAAVVGAHAAAGEEGVEAAMAAAKEGAERLRASGDRASEAQGLSILSGAHLLAGEHGEALAAAEESLSIYRELGDKFCEARMLHEISRIHLRADEESKALESYQESLAVAQDAGDRRYHARSLSAIARVHLLGQEPDKALEAGAEALALYQQCEDREGQGVVLLNMSSAHMLKEQINTALEVAGEAQALFQELEHRQRQAQASFFIAEAYLRGERYEPALQAATKARQLCQSVGVKVEEADVLAFIGQCNLALAGRIGDSKDKDEQKRARKLFLAALKAGKEGLALARKLVADDPKRVLLSNLLMIVAQSQGALGKSKEALKAANEALKIARENADQLAECSAHVLLAQVHFWNDRPDDARREVSTGLDFARRLQDDYLESLAAGLLEQLDPSAALAGSARAAPALATPAAAAASSAGDVGLGPYSGPSADSLIPRINEIAINLLAVDEVAQDQPLMDSGLDSLSMVQLRNTLHQQFPGVPMPASLLFDHPSVRAVAENIVDELKAAHDAGRPLM